MQNSKYQLWTPIVFFLIQLQMAWADQNADVLTHKTAIGRKEQVGQVHYRLKFRFQRKADVIGGETNIDVELTHLNADLRIDSFNHVISLVTVDGQKIGDYIHNEGHIVIPKRHLKRKLTVGIKYQFKFSQTGQGLMKYTDPVDQKEYIYSDLEPYGAHLIFPCFDQPNLKATYALTVDAPLDYVVIGNALIESVERRSNSKVTVFEPTEKISTYLFFLGGGDYFQWKTDYNGLPMSIWARQSLKQYVDADEIFKITKRGLKWFNEYFEYPYPFTKYDHVFSPELGPGAMENPGAVTMNERMIYRGPQPESTYLDRANTILHEMAHMWFGDLVTMDWWNDLWLNESFATFMAYKSQSELGWGEKAWQDLVDLKDWALWQDQLVTTHPIEGEVADTTVAETIFDGITYAKGASSLKQLEYFVGSVGFRTGVANYFKKYAWQNTTRKNFMDEIASASQIDLDVWTKSWLQTAGPNKVRAQFSCHKNKIEKFQLIQEKSVSGVLSPHRTQLGLAYKRDGKFIIQTYTVGYDRAVNDLPQLSGVECPDFVFPNYGDYDYSLAFFDEKSLKNLKSLVATSKSPLERQIIWRNLKHMALNGQFTLANYLTLFLKASAFENDAFVLNYITGRNSFFRDIYDLFLTKKHRNRLHYFAGPFMFGELKKSFVDKQFNKGLYWLDLYVATARSDSDLTTLKQMLADPKAVVPNLNLSQEHRWKIVRAMARISSSQEVRELIEAEYKRDPSTYGHKNYLSAKVALPSLKDKQWAWDHMTGKLGDWSLAIKREAGGEFYNPDREHLTTVFADKFFDFATSYDWNGNPFQVARVFKALFPSTYCDRSFLDRSERELERLKAQGPIAQALDRAWLEANDDLLECWEVRKFNGL